MYIDRLGFLCSSDGKESICLQCGDLGSIPGLGRFPREGKGNPLQYSGLENSRDCIVYGVTKSQTLLSDFHFTSLDMLIDASNWNSISKSRWCLLAKIESR